jgi:t-SNARE complex subunit (syntaxin)
VFCKYASLFAAIETKEVRRIENDVIDTSDNAGDASSTTKNATTTTRATQRNPLASY